MKLLCLSGSPRHDERIQTVHTRPYVIFEQHYRPLFLLTSGVSRISVFDRCL
jgi:hypothetical protein